MTKIDHLEIAVGHMRKAASALLMSSADLGTPRLIIAAQVLCETMARDLAELVDKEKIRARHRVNP